MIGRLWIFLSLASPLVVSKELSTAALCRSNNTHIAWYERNDAHSARPISCDYQKIREAQAEAYRFLASHVMAFDLPFRETLGFVAEEGAVSGKDMPDGLGNGLVLPTIEYALRSKVEYEHADRIPKAIWLEFVLNYANTNEARSNWRPLLYEKLAHLRGYDIRETVKRLNTHMFTILAPKNSETIYFNSGQTPLVFDTMSVLQFGYASCTGLAILFVNALRTLGVPSRVVGTNAWHQRPEEGNHNWVEVYVDGEWHFMEPSPNQTIIDSIDRHPCLRWFCQSDRFTPYAQNTTKVYAAVLKARSATYYPLAWEPSNTQVPGDDVSERYQRICGSCGLQSSTTV